MGRAGHSMNSYIKMEDDRAHRQMQQVTLITPIVNILARTCGRPENMPFYDGPPNLWELYIIYNLWIVRDGPRWAHLQHATPDRRE